MTRFDIPWEDNYIGIWICEPSRVLTIRKVGHRKYVASLTIGGEPVLRPWMDGAPTIDMPAEFTVDVLDGPDFCVDLWPPKRRLSMHLGYESRYDLDQKQREVLTLVISCDEHMPENPRVYCDVIGGLQNFVRAGINED